MNMYIVGLIAWLLIVVGTLGSILPFLPGLPVAWLGLLLYAVYTHFQTVTVWGLTLFGVLIGMTIVLDVVAPAIVASGQKASKYGVVGAFLGGFLGVFFLGPIGILLGPFVGAFTGEILNASRAKHALRIAWASLFGLIVSSAFKLMVGTIMFVYFLFKFF